MGSPLLQVMERDETDRIWGMLYELESGEQAEYFLAFCR